MEVKTEHETEITSKKQPPLNREGEKDLGYEVIWPLLSLALGRPLHTLDVRRRAHIQKGSKVLELGAGYPLWKLYSGMVGQTGAFFSIEINKNIAKRSKKIIGILNLLKRNPPERILIADARSLPFRSNSMDIVIESNVVINLGREDIYRIYSEAFRVLKPGGRILSAFQEMVGDKDPPYHTASGAMKILEETGFMNVKRALGMPVLLAWNRFALGEKPQ